MSAMSNAPLHSRPPLRLVLSGIGAAFLLATTVAVGLYLGTETRDRFVAVETSWERYVDEAERRGALLSRIRELLGYGGIIHNFKNYVLRQEPRYLATLESQLAEFGETVSRYRAAGATPLEERSLAAIEKTVAIYRSMIPVAREAAQQGWPAAQTDRLVKVDDTPAIDALAALDRFWRDQRRATVSSVEASVTRGQALIARGFDFLMALGVIALVIYGLFFLLQHELRHTIARLSEELDERHAAEHAAKKFQRAVDQSPATIIITDTDARIEYVNRAFCTVTGYGPEEVIGQTPKMLQSGDADAGTYLALRERLTAGHDWRGVFRNRKKGGGSYWASTAILPLRDETGAITHFIGIGEDITEKRAARDQMHRAQKMEAVGLLASGVAHDFNNILTTIIGNVFLAREKETEKDKERENERHGGASADHIAELDQIDIAAKRARNLVSEILTFARRQPGAPSAVRVEDALGAVVRLLRASIPTSLTIRTEVSAPDLWVRADPTRLHQVVMNLATNAAEAVDLAGGEIVIRVARTGANGAGRIMLSVSDNGPGIPAETRERIFEPFFSTKPVGKGTGLGLAVVTHLVDEMEGDIALDSAAGRGTTFRLTLPAAAAAKREATADSRASPGHGARILLVDDDPDVVRTCSGVLTRLGYDVTATTSPYDALDRFEAEPESYALVMTDFVMPELNGQQVCEAVRGLNTACPLIVYSGYQPATLDLDSLQPIRVLEKPLDPVQLSVAVNQMMLRDCAD